MCFVERSFVTVWDMPFLSEAVRGLSPLSYLEAYSRSGLE